MKRLIVLAVAVNLLLSCRTKNSEPQSGVLPVAGTWKLITGTLIENGDTVFTDYTKGVSFIKIINATHFAFLQHDLTQGKDTSAVFVAGGGKYTLQDSLYTEHLEYCSAREWEGHSFTFTIEIKNDTLIQTGQEQVKEAGINRLNIEKYVRMPV
jgi:hypothetical protein